MTRHTARSSSAFICTMFLAVALSGCTVAFISYYDESTDKAITELHRKLETFFIALDARLGTPAAVHEVWKDTYHDLRLSMSALELRVNALPMNSITQEQAGNVKRNIDLLEQLHKTGFGGNIEAQRAVIAAVRQDFNTSLAAILKLELAKKRGEK